MKFLSHFPQINNPAKMYLLLLSTELQPIRGQSPPEKCRRYILGGYGTEWHLIGRASRGLIRPSRGAKPEPGMAAVAAVRFPLRLTKRWKPICRAVNVLEKAKQKQVIALGRLG
ncbi:MAG: hypothetical protein P4K86_01220 [Terracidiphilus sp.]|nr:hypothetical protein [Terracidiphilus sp.]